MKQCDLKNLEFKRVFTSICSPVMETLAFWAMANTRRRKVLVRADGSSGGAADSTGGRTCKVGWKSSGIRSFLQHPNDENPGTTQKEMMVMVMKAMRPIVSKIL